MNFTKRKLLLKQLLDAQQAARDEFTLVTQTAIRRQKVICTNCKKESPFGGWGFVQDHWYTSPSGCTEGDYWNASETRLCHIVCPECNVMNYLCNHPQKDFLLDLIENQRVSKEQIFAVLWDRHGRDAKPEQVFPKKPESVFL